MFLYITSYIYFCLGEICILFNKKKSIEKLYVILILLFMGFYSGLRENDVDYKNYYEMYYGLIPMASYGYGILVKIFKNIGFDYKQFIFVISFINIFLLYKLFSYNNNKLYISLMVYLGYFFLIKNMNQYRNLLAILLIFNFVKDIFYKKKIGVSIFYLTGVLIHTSSLIILFLPFLNFFKNIIEKNIRNILMLILVLSMILYKFNIIKSLANFLIKIGIPYISDKINAYMYTSIDYSGIKHILGLRDFKYFIIALAIIYLLDYRENIFYKKMIIIAFFLGILLKWSLSFNIVLSDRLSDIFFILEPLILGMLYRNNFYKTQKIVYILLIVGVLSYNLLQVYFSLKNIVLTFY